MVDTNGEKGQITRVAWSHVIATNAGPTFVDDLLAAVAQLFEVSSKDLVKLSRTEAFRDPREDPIVLDAPSRRACMVRLFALSASEDKRISVAELQGLIRRAEQFGSK